MSTRAFWRSAAVAVSVITLSSCGFVHDETLVARYKLVAVDDDGQMQMCWGLDNGSCVGDAFPAETLFEAGFNDAYVVLGRHPNELKKSITEYYYIIRDHHTEDKESGAPYGRVRGPYNDNQWVSLKRQMHLPEFTRIFPDL